MVAMVVLALGLGVALGAGLLRRPGPSRARASSSSLPAASSTSSSTTTAPATLRVLGVTPGDGATGVEPGPLNVQLSEAPAADSPTPSVSPAVAGSWSTTSNGFVFTPSVQFPPETTVTVSVPSGTTGVRGRDGATLATAVTSSFTMARGSTLRLQQLLSLLQYSPLSWMPAGSPIAVSDAAGLSAAIYAPPAGSFRWARHGWPGALRRLWREGVDSLFTRGLIMSFQADHGLNPDGRISPALWQALTKAYSTNETNTGGYNFALANKARPQTLTIWHDGRVVLVSPANSGIAGSPTPDGIFPVYTRLRSQVMRGTNPNGSHYADLVQYVAYFHRNDAVHYMPRAGYGIPQSLGCIELPLAQAARAWPYLAYGTLVDVVH